MKLTPNKNRLVIKAIEPEGTSKGGIIIPDAAKEASKFGHVVAIGADVKDFAVGDVVLFVHFSGTEFELGGDKFLSFKAEDVHLKMEE